MRRSTIDPWDRSAVEAMEEVARASEAKDGHPRCTAFVGVDCQLLRSVGRWSAGTQLETSIHASYCHEIKQASKFIYIEVRRPDAQRAARQPAG